MNQEGLTQVHLQTGDCRPETASGQLSQRTWVRTDTVLWRQVVNGVLLLAMDQEEPVVLTGAGALLWERLGEPSTDEALARSLSDAYGRPLDEVQHNLLAVLADLAARDLVRARP